MVTSPASPAPRGAGSRGTTGSRDSAASRHTRNPALTIRLLGPVDIRVGDAPLAVDTRKAVALLAHLAVIGRPVARESLAALLWPESDGTDARGALRRTLSVLSAALGGIALSVDRAVVAVQPADVALDLDGFRSALARVRAHVHGPDDVCAVCVAALDEAVALHRGDFMEGFGLRDSDAFDDWQRGEAEAYRRELDGALERLTRGQVAAGHWEAAIEAGRRWLGLDPLHEPAHRLLMLALARAGETAAALRQYRECVRVLDRELGVSPLPETAALYDAIGAGRIGVGATQIPASSNIGGPDADNHPNPRPPAAGPVVAPMVGRDRELALLLGDRTPGTRGRFIAVEGEAGIGKSRLVAALTERVTSAGGVALVVRCQRGEEGIAFGVVVELLTAGLGTPGAAERLGRLRPSDIAEAARLVPQFNEATPGGDPAPADQPGARARLLRGLVDVLTGSVAGPTPGFLVVEDLQWVDPSSLEVLEYLVRRLAERPVTLFVTWRPEDLPVIGGPAVLRAEAERLHLAAGSIALDRLGRSAVAELTRSIRPETSDPDLDWLFGESEGLPLFVVEYLAGAEDGTGPSQADPVSDRSGSGAGAFPRSGPVPRAASVPLAVQGLIRTRISAVGDTAGQLLTAAAVIGRSFDLSTLRAASGRSEEETVDAVDELIRRGIVRETNRDREPAYDFSHGRIRDVAYESTSLARRRLLHRRVAETLRGGRGPIDPFAWPIIAHHLHEAGLDNEAALAYRAAGDHARSISANEEALDHYRSALALGNADVSGLHLAIGDLQTLAGAYAAALTSYETGAALAKPGGLGAVEHRLGLLAARRGDWSAARRHLELALAETDRPDGRTGGSGATSEPLSAGPGSSPRSRILADLSVALDRLGDAEAARSRAASALETAVAVDDAAAVARARSLLGMLARRRGSLDEARRELESALRVGATSDASIRIAALNNLALVAVDEGELEAAIELWTQALGLCVAQGDRHREAALHNNLADALHAAGREPEAMDHLKRAVALFADVGERGTLEPAIWQLVDW